MDLRPNPKELLELIKQEELTQLKDNRGKLKIFLGAAPGVGKTYAMLEGALEAKKEGIDVVVGLVETHGRQETEILLNKLEILPKQAINYKGKDRLEFDLDGVLRRDPKLVLVDELAHCNISGARHNKRWQDILELLDSGIDVYTTINVQHIESLNNIVAQLINVIVRETVPDTILDKAHAIELVDLPPEDLIKRLKEGKVYVSADIIGLATDHFFRKENLIALRELAFRITAEQIHAEELLRRMRGSIEKIWPHKERLLVCIGPDLIAAKLIRSAFRMAKRLKADWIAVHVELPQVKLSESDHNNVIRNLQLVEQLGGQAFDIGGTNIAKEIINFSRECNITKIILGKTSRSRFKEIFNPSLANELVHLGDDLDLHILSNNIKNNNFIKTIKIKEPYNFMIIAGLGFSGLCLLINYLVFKYLDLNPEFNNKQYLLNFIITVLFSQIIYYLLVFTKKREKFFCAREQRTATLHLLNKKLAYTRGVQQLLNIAIVHVARVFNSEVLILLPDNSNTSMHSLIAYNQNNQKVTLSPKEESVAEWVYKLGQIAGLGTETLPDNDAIYLPLLGSNSSIGVMRVLPFVPRDLSTPAQRHLLENFCNQTAMALEVEMLQTTTYSS
jgi:two-component system, OmpR family, sensor histidine kinase KdpD